MDLTYRRLAPDEVDKALETLTQWNTDGLQVGRTFQFSTYSAGVLFAAAVGHLADHLNHHPDIALAYKKVTVRLTTHDVGGISPYDLELARRIDAIA
jgi:4a-hydroxytetrahydrobiopterin dehydratase